MLYILLGIFFFYLLLLFLFYSKKEKGNEIHNLASSNYSNSEFHKQLQESIKLREKYIEEKAARKDARTKEYLLTYNSMKFIQLNPSMKKTKKKLIKDIPEFKYSTIRSNTPKYKANNFISIDVETTGLSAAKDKIIEISAIKFINGEAVECLSSLINPKIPITNEITNITHITNEMVKDSPEIEYIISNFSEFIKGFNIVGYNLPFDLKFLHKNGMEFFTEKRYFFDVLPLCRKYFKNSLYNYKLDTVCEHVELYRQNQHRSTDDALATGIIFRDISNKIIDNTYDYYQTTNNE